MTGRVLRDETPSATFNLSKVHQTFVIVYFKERRCFFLVDSLHFRSTPWNRKSEFYENRATLLLATYLRTSIRNSSYFKLRKCSHAVVLTALLCVAGNCEEWGSCRTSSDWSACGRYSDDKVRLTSLQVRFVLLLPQVRMGVYPGERVNQRTPCQEPVQEL
jgi:hypothetical protein